MGKFSSVEALILLRVTFRRLCPIIRNVSMLVFCCIK